MNDLRNVFLLGYDDVHAQHLARIADAHRFNFHPLLQASELIYLEEYDFDGLLDKARQALNDFDGPVHGIINHWDFPVDAIHAILCAERGLPGPSLEAVMKCSHKYWSRLEQRKVAPESTPEFCAVDPFDPRARERLTVDYPFWLKPVKGYASMLGFLVENEADFDHAIELAQEHIGRLGEPVNRILDRLELPPEVAGVDGNHMIAEQLIGGIELAPEGAVFQGTFRAHGIIDVLPGHTPSSFLAVAYPSRHPEAIQQRVMDIASRVLGQVGFDDGCFNVEFFWDRDTDRLWIVEVNPRLSQSHSDLFEKVDGTSNHQVAVRVAVGEEPTLVHGSGTHRHAAKFWHRRYDKSDALVKRVPDEQDIARLHAQQGDTQVVVLLEQGQRLSELLDQDQDSFVLAELMIGGDTADDVMRRYEEAARLLPFEFEPVEEEATEA